MRQRHGPNAALAASDTPAARQPGTNGKRTVRSLLLALAASVTLLLTSCVEDLPDAPPGPNEFTYLPAHPEYQFLHRLGAPAPLPEHGYASLGRRVTEMEQLIEIAHFITHQGCPAPQIVPPQLLDYYFPPDMLDTFSATAVCDNGNGDVISLMKPDHEARFESAYRNVPDLYQIRWKQVAQDADQDCCGNNPEEDASVYAFDHWAYAPIGVGNGFVVFEVLHAEGHNASTGSAWTYAGLAGLVCVKGENPEGTMPLGRNGRPLNLRNAASVGCYLQVGY